MQSLGIRYAVVGSLASSAHGIYRATGASPNAPATYFAWRDQQHSFASLAAAEAWGVLRLPAMAGRKRTHAEARRRNIRLLAYNARFLMVTWVRVPHIFRGR